VSYFSKVFEAWRRHRQEETIAQAKLARWPTKMRTFGYRPLSPALAKYASLNSEKRKARSISHTTGSIYFDGAPVAFWLASIATWIYCTVNYGFLLGFGLGWLPAIIIGVVAAALWPLVVLLIAVLAIMYVAVL
jgi:hypothetical protein